MQRYSLQVVTPPADEPLTTAEAKSQIRLETPADDTLVASYVKAAREWYEDIAGRALINQTLEARFDEFPGERDEKRDPARWPLVERYALFLPQAPLSSVTSIKYDDASGVEQTLAGSAYAAKGILAKDEPGRIVPAFGTSWPTTRAMPECVRVRYVAGFGTAGSAVPESIRQCLRLLVAHQYEMRAPIVTGTIVAELPHAVRDLLWKNRVRLAA